MASLNIPEEDINQIKKLVQLEEETQESLIKSLSEAPIGCWADELTEFITKNTNIETKDANGIVNLLFTMTINKRFLEEPLDDFLDKVLLAIKEHEDEELKADDKLKDLLQRILSFSNIQITTKALELESEREKLLEDIRIITDIRPIFDDKNTEDIKANLIIHNLKIRYKELGSSHEIYIALDSDDLSQLKEQIIRAEKKENRIRKGIRNIDFIKSK